MKWGMIARADTSRGLGRQCEAIWKHLAPDRLLVIDSTDISPYPMDPTLVDAADIVVTRERMIDAIEDDAFLQDLDVVYTFETPYDFALYDLARFGGVRTVCHTNPELWPYTGTDLADVPRPDVIWAPTGWRWAEIRAAAWNRQTMRLVAQPVDRAAFPERQISQVRTVLHVIGHRAMADRNGTYLFAQALRSVRSPVRVIIRSQSKVGRSFWRGISPSVDLHVEVGNVADPAALYADADVLVLPRRYGGLCLPAQEAMSCGLPVLMTDCPPNDYYAARDAWIPSRQSDTLRMQGGMIPCFEANPRAIAAMIDRLYNDDGWVAGLAGWSRMRADALSWEAQERQWRDALDEAAAVLV